MPSLHAEHRPLLCLASINTCVRLADVQESSTYASVSACMHLWRLAECSLSPTDCALSMQKHSAAAHEAAAAAAEAVKHSSDQEALTGNAPQQKEAAERSQTPGRAVSPEILPHGADAGHLAEIKQEALPPLGLEKPSQVENSKLAQPAVPDTAAMPGPAGTGTALHASAGLWQNAQASL